ncbi:MAG: hypothetical protein P4L49_11490 [Desulfosporosinus sp.]|nr:hypothetical protein [Desulfosporosinus sp.]
MSNLAHIKYSPLVDRMKKESGDRSNPIWLLINPKYPAVLYDIWTPILYEIQNIVYRKLRARIDTENIFIKNAVSDIGIVSKNANNSAVDLAEERMMLKESLLKHQPKILITFGTITYELVRRVCELRPEEGPNYWSTTNLGNEFERSIANFDINQINRIPLPRRVMRNDKFIEEFDDFSWERNEAYFREVGAKIADRIIENKDSLKIWI